MAKKKPESAQVQSENDDAPKRRQVALDEDLYRKGGFIAKAKGVSLPDYVNNLLRPLIEADLPKALDLMGLGPTPRK